MDQDILELLQRLEPVILEHWHRGMVPDDTKHLRPFLLLGHHETFVRALQKQGLAKITEGTPNSNTINTWVLTPLGKRAFQAIADLAATERALLD
jgi:hypothetical protein